MQPTLAFHTISLIGCGASGAYAPGPEEEEEPLLYTFLL